MSLEKNILILIIVLSLNYCTGQSPVMGDSACIDNIEFICSNYQQIFFHFSKKKIPGILKRQISSLDQEKFRIVNPGKDYRKTDVVTKPRLPNKELLMIGEYENYNVLVYNEGGLGRHTGCIIATTTNGKISQICEAFFYGRPGKPEDVYMLLQSKKYRISNMWY